MHETSERAHAPCASARRRRPGGGGGRASSSARRSSHRRGSGACSSGKRAMASSPSSATSAASGRAPRSSCTGRNPAHASAPCCSTSAAECGAEVRGYGQCWYQREPAGPIAAAGLCEIIWWCGELHPRCSSPRPARAERTEVRARGAVSQYSDLPQDSSASCAACANPATRCSSPCCQ